MIVHFTKTSLKNLEDIFSYNQDYSLDYAMKFNNEVIDIIVENLSNFPEMGSIHNKNKSIRKLVLKGYNVYYVNAEKVIYILYIFGWKLSKNEEIEDPKFKLPSFD